jgi:hypothetical protein
MRFRPVSSGAAQNQSSSHSSNQPREETFLKPTTPYFRPASFAPEGYFQCLPSVPKSPQAATPTLMNSRASRAQRCYVSVGYLSEVNRKGKGRVSKKA